VSAPGDPVRVAGSRSHTTPETARFLQRLGEHTLLPVGSSIKFCLIAQGDADLYPRFGPTSEWDTAAGQALLEAAGGHVMRMDGHRLRYNCRESLENGDFIAFNHAGILPARAVP
jgi:3'(2'), 5'-bisphosphate nucleotidase